MKKTVFLAAALIALMAAALPAQWTGTSRLGKAFENASITSVIFLPRDNDANFFGYFGVGTGGKMGQDTTGMNWTDVPNSFGTTDINGIAAGPNRLVAVGAGGKIAYSASRARAGVHNWTQVANSPFGTVNIRGICYGNGRFVAVGEGSTIAVSTDGVTWTRAQSPYGNNSRVIWAKDKFVVVCDGGTAYSTDGITWTKSANDPFAGLNFGGQPIIPVISIAYGANKFVVGTSPGAMAYSADGITWTRVPNSIFGNNRVRSIAFQGDGPAGTDKFVAVGDGGKIAYSTDGITWTAGAVTPFASSPIFNVCYGNGTFIISGEKGVSAWSSYTGLK
jgi:hypothetical protein